MSAGHATGVRPSRLLIALGITLGLIVAEVVAARAASSSALAADAGHNLADVAVILIGLGATRLALRRPTAAHSFGFHRATILAGLANLVVLAVITVLIVVHAASRLAHPPAVDGGTVAVVAAGAIVANAAAALLLARNRDLGARVVGLHLLADALSSVAVLVAGLVIATTGRFAILDPVASLAVAAIIAIGGARLAWEAIDVLLEGAPADLDLGELAATMRSVPGVTEVHDLHCWSISSEVRALSAHVLLAGEPTLETAQAVGATIKTRIAERYGIAHTTLELERDPCADEGELACPIEEASDAGGRQPRAVTSTRRSPAP